MNDNEDPAFEFKVTRLRECPFDDIGDTPVRIVAFWRQHVQSASWFQEEKETLVLFVLNVRRKITHMNMISIGTLNTLLVHPREVFRPAIIANAAAICVAHNHPSGDPSPSQSDIAVTRDLFRAGQLLKIDLVDHIIIGKASPESPEGYCSLRELNHTFFV